MAPVVDFAAMWPFIVQAAIVAVVVAIGTVIMTRPNRGERMRAQLRRK